MNRVNIEPTMERVLRIIKVSAERPMKPHGGDSETCDPGK